MALCIYRRAGFALILSGISGSAQAQDLGGLQLSAAYTAEAWRNARGGLRTGSVYLDNLEVAAQVDLRALPTWRAATIRISGFHNNARTLSNAIVGDLQSVSNKDAGGGTRLYEAWMRQSYGDAALKVGRIDLNNEFSVNQTAALFLNGAQGIGLDVSQMSEDGASLFPDTSLGAIGSASLPNHWTLRIGGFDGAQRGLGPPPDTALEVGRNGGALLIAEASHFTQGRTRLTFGAWRHTAKFARLMRPARSGHASGAYGLVEWTVAQNGGRRLEGFARLGFADPKTLQITTHLSAGAVLTHPFFGINGEAVGIALAVAENSDDFRRAQRLSGSPARRRETNVELTYRFAPKPWLHVQPDVQYVIHPGAVRGRGNALVFGVRATLAWSTQ